jgi:hypothetical protein
MNVEFGAEAALFPEKEYINGIAASVWYESIGLTFLYISANSKKCLKNLGSLNSKKRF